MAQVALAISSDPVLAAYLHTALCKDRGFAQLELTVSIAEAKRLLRRMRPTLVVVDLTAVDPHEWGVTRSMKEASPGCRVICVALSRSDIAVDSFRALLNCEALVGKPMLVSDGSSVLNAVLNGWIVTDPAFTTVIVEMLRDPSDLHLRRFLERELTKGERRVLRLIGLGLRNVDIARKLTITPSTVRTHMNRLFRKLNVRSRVHAALLALKAGWVQFDEIEGPTVAKDRYDTEG